MAGLETEGRSHDMGLHNEQLSGRKMQTFFSPDDSENVVYPWAYDVDFNKRTEIDMADLTPTEVNIKIRELMAEGYGSIVIKNPGSRHSIGVGILNKLNITYEGSLGYFGCGLIDGPNVRINGRVGW